VICITHLPQVAAHAENMYYIQKNKTKEGRTVTKLGVLNGNEKIERIAVMLGGTKVTDAMRSHAKDLLKSAGNLR
ncbi:MAG: DNA repair protein RecN, partial [Deltaproteobacteria bacterium]|nr:DNA repair protein RecN [Deltaproteobacteria bacterium]